MNFMQPIQKYNYNQLYAHSIEQPDAFWLTEAKALSWFQQPTIGYTETDEGLPQWFADGQLNACYLALDVHIEQGLADRVALIYDSPVTQTQQRITFGQLHREVAQLAGGLQALGLQVGDTVVIYMPMIPQAVYAMLACARIGVTHSVVFGGFAPHELAIRIDDCKPKVLITASSGIEVDKLIAYKPMVDEAIALAGHQPQKVVVFNRKLGARIPFKPRDVDYDALVYGSDPVECVSVPSTHPLYILYTSGTTGKPKGIVRDTGGYATALFASM